MKIRMSIAAAFALIAAPTGAASAQSQIGREHVSVEFRYDAGKSPTANYLHFRRMADRACAPSSPSPLAFSLHRTACARDLMDRMVASMGRADLAAIHAGRAGVVFAAR